LVRQGLTKDKSFITLRRLTSAKDAMLAWMEGLKCPRIPDSSMLGSPGEVNASTVPIPKALNVTKCNRKKLALFASFLISVLNL